MLSWIKKYWLIPLVAAGAAIFWLLKISSETPRERVNFELDVADAKANAKKDVVNYGTHVAVEKLKRQHSEKVRQLAKEQGANFSVLLADPPNLAVAALRSARRAAIKRKKRAG